MDIRRSWVTPGRTRIYALSEYARQLDICDVTVRNMIERGEIEAVRLAKHVTVVVERLAEPAEAAA